MRTRHILGALLMALLFAAIPHCASAQSTRELHAWLEQSGSVPPVPQWFGCFRELKDKLYNKAESRKCLDSILSHAEIEKGKIAFKRRKNEDLLTFRVESPSLIVTDVDLGVSAGELAKIHELLAANSNALRPGEAYEPYREGSSWLILDLLFRSQGRRAGVSRTVHLDYNKKTAQVAFKIWEGPIGTPEPLVPPYAEPCKITNGYFSWMDADDLSPVDFVERQMKTKWCGCFSEGDVRDDSAALRGMKFLKEANISVDGSGDSRSINMHLRGNAIPIAEVRVRGYGLLQGVAEGETPPLTVHPGDTYSHSATRNLQELLEKSFSKSGRRVKVFADVEMTVSGEAKLEFSVLAYPDDIVYINGTPFDVTLHDEM
jgi:hypothetical protein